MGKDKKADKIIAKYVKICAGIAALTGPVPGTSAALTAAEINMCIELGELYGHTYTPQEMTAIISGTLGVSLIAKTIAIEAATAALFFAIPIKVAIAVASCKKIGNLMKEYLISRQPPSIAF